MLRIQFQIRSVFSNFANTDPDPLRLNEDELDAKGVMLKTKISNFNVCIWIHNTVFFIPAGCKSDYVFRGNPEGRQVPCALRSS